MVTVTTELEQKLEQIEIKTAQEIPKSTRIALVDSGEIRLEVGADGLYLVFDCECKDALPYCHANCCGMPGTLVNPDEVKNLNKLAERVEKRLVNFNSKYNRPEMRRCADGWCTALNREKYLCEIYDDRPDVCRDFHCSRGSTRGWDASRIRRFKEYEG